MKKLLMGLLVLGSISASAMEIGNETIKLNAIVISSSIDTVYATAKNALNSENPNNNYLYFMSPEHEQNIWDEETGDYILNNRAIAATMVCEQVGWTSLDKPSFSCDITVIMP
jgi:hypothetical protein